MRFNDVATLLAAWTPYLLSGFGWNISISLVAQGLGSVVGVALARGRLSRGRVRRRIAGAATALMRSVPKFVFQFYLIFILPHGFTFPLSRIAVDVPSWLAASLALSLAVAGFVSDNLMLPLGLTGAARARALKAHIVDWSNYFVIVVMASSTASVIGVSELVSRCNTVVNASGSTTALLWIYLYAMLWFLGFCLACKALMSVAAHCLAQAWPPTSSDDTS